jgi:hypothetical protein
MATKKAKRKRTSSPKRHKINKPSGKKRLVKKKAAQKSKKSKAKRTIRRPRGHADTGELVSYGRRGIGARSGGQSGDTQGINAGPDVDSESVEELLEEGQSYEAEVVEGVENAPGPDEGEVRTHEVDEDDVPEEYRDRD